MTGLGLMIGPVIGGFLYVTVGYFWSFAVFGGILCVSLAITMFITPNILNASIFENEEDMNSS